MQLIIILTADSMIRHVIICGCEVCIQIQKGDLTCDEKSIKERHTVDRKMFFERAMLFPGLLRQLAESRCTGFDWTGPRYDPKQQNKTDYFSRR